MPFPTLKRGANRRCAYGAGFSLRGLGVVRLKYWFPTQAAQAKTRRGWGTRDCFGEEKRQRQEQPQILRLR